MLVTRHLSASLALLFTLAAQPVFAAGTLIISEFRVRGPNGANDEFIEIYNDSGADHTVTSVSGTGYAVAASDGVIRCSIPDGTVVPAGGHYLCVNSVGYSLASYPAGDGTTATGDATYATDVPDNAGLALFNNNTGGGSFTLANRFDAIGSTSEANTLYKEGSGYPALTPFSIDYAFARDTCGKNGAVNLLGPCTISTPKDTDDNAADFYFVDTNGTSAGAGQRLGAPGPENLSSPVSLGSTFSDARLDDTVGEFDPPNVVRDFTSDPANNSTFGTISIRRRFTNDTGSPVTRLRFRITDLDTFPAASGFADLRPRTSATVVVAGVNDAATCAATGAPATPPCTLSVLGTTLEQPPSQPNGGGFNSSMGAGTVTLGTPLADGATIDAHFLFGIQQTGDYRVAIELEALPSGGDSVFLQCNTQGCPPPAVSSIVRADPDPTSAASVDYTVTFSEPVTGVDQSDFAVTTVGIAGASVTNVAGSDAIYTVTVATGTGDGTIRLDVADDDTIVNDLLRPLGDAGPGNGDFTTGEIYTRNDLGAGCGDGVTDVGEECDDGPANSDTDPDACRTDCTASRCGDGVTDTGEECDGTIACTSSCLNAVCGDGIAQPGTEECDDGASNSDADADACRTDCVSPSCGDGVTDTGEECDDGNTDDEDGCSPICHVDVLHIGGDDGCNVHGSSHSLDRMFALLFLLGMLARNARRLRLHD